MSHESKNMTRGKKNERCSSFVSCRKEKKKEKIKIINNKTKKKWNETKSRKKEEIFSFFFFSPGMKRKPRTWQSYEKDSTSACSFFLCVYTFVLLVALARNMTTWSKAEKKDSDECLRLPFSISFLFFPFVRSRVTARRLRDTVCASRVARPRSRKFVCGVAVLCVRARGCKYNN